ncbi:MAG TPA: DUF4913 domain-containing protein [Acidimicrobiia bacterium]|jgi:hypothetical protein|nr:DUF4913 domain-containing protein [Acidimicrobiia bacterium]
MTTAATASLAELDARLARLESSYEALEEALALPSPTTAPAGAESGAAPPKPFYSNVQAWVAGWFAPTFARRLGTTRWCAQWWLHAEAIVRLEALWRSWETLRLDPNLGMATWLRDHLDPQRQVLMGDSGPFQACEGTEHNPPPELPVLPAPAGYWPSPEGDAE